VVSVEKKMMSESVRCITRHCSAFGATFAPLPLGETGRPDRMLQ
jgi:hypothetical protein